MIDHDSESLEDLLIVKEPSEHDKVLLAAIAGRYPYPHPMGVLSQDIAEGWGLTIQQLNTECRNIWANGFRPPVTRFTKEDSHDHTS